MSTKNKKIIIAVIALGTPIICLLNIWVGIATGSVMASVGLLTAIPQQTNFSQLSQPAKDWINRLPNARDFKYRLNTLSRKNEIVWVEKMIDLRLLRQH